MLGLVMTCNDVACRGRYCVDLACNGWMTWPCLSGKSGRTWRCVQQQVEKFSKNVKALPNISGQSYLQFVCDVKNEPWWSGSIFSKNTRASNFGVPYFEKDPQADTVSDTPSDIIQLWLPMCFDPELREVACSHRGSGALNHQGDEVTATRSNRRAWTVDKHRWLWHAMDQDSRPTRPRFLDDFRLFLWFLSLFLVNEHNLLVGVVMKSSTLLTTYCRVSTHFKTSWTWA